MEKLREAFLDYQMDFYYEIENLKKYYEEKGANPSKINKILKIQEEFNEKIDQFLKKV